MSKLLTVFGATGGQGGSVIKAVLADAHLSKQWKLRGVTRDPSKPAAQDLAKKGVELVTANMDSKNSITKAIKGSTAVFSVTDFFDTKDAALETVQGKNVADAVKELGIQQLIFSSLINASKASNGRLTVSHIQSKANVEEYIRKLGIEATFVLPGYYMSNFPQMLRKQDDGSFNLAFPVGKTAIFPLIDIPEDYGKFVLPALRDAEKWNGKQIYAAIEYYTLERIIAEFEEGTDKKINFKQVTNEQYGNFWPPFMAEEMLGNHLLLEETEMPGYYGGADLEESLNAVKEPLTTWKDFVAKATEWK